MLGIDLHWRQSAAPPAHHWATSLPLWSKPEIYRRLDHFQHWELVYRWQCCCRPLWVACFVAHYQQLWQTWRRRNEVQEACRRPDCRWMGLRRQCWQPAESVGEGWKIVSEVRICSTLREPIEMFYMVIGRIHRRSEGARSGDSGDLVLPTAALPNLTAVLFLFSRCSVVNVIILGKKDNGVETFSSFKV